MSSSQSPPPRSNLRVVDGGTFICASQEMLALDPSCMAATMASPSVATPSSSVARRLDKVRAGLWMVFGVVEKGFSSAGGCTSSSSSIGRSVEATTGRGVAAAQNHSHKTVDNSSSTNNTTTATTGSSSSSTRGSSSATTTSTAASAMAAAFAQRIAELPPKPLDEEEEAATNHSNIPASTSNPNLSTDEYLSDSSSGSPTVKNTLNGVAATASCGGAGGPVDHHHSSFSSGTIRELVILNESSLDSLSVTVEFLQELLWEPLEPAVQAFTGQLGLFSANSLPPPSSLSAADVAAISAAAGLAVEKEGGQQGDGGEGEAVVVGRSGRCWGDLIHVWYNRVCELTCLGEQFGIIDLVGMPLGVVCGCYEMGDAGLHQLQVVRKSGRKGMECSAEEGGGEEIWAIRISFANEEDGMVAR
eukprot:GHVS01093866.1.p1 GENE.GHVS01093866.1~~GHVS01093866.1.p1  ORF type:complete len:417 (+),score=130.84 GHVS01093866.1:361-1611(+)